MLWLGDYSSWQWPVWARPDMSKAIVLMIYTMVRTCIPLLNVIRVQLSQISPNMISHAIGRKWSSFPSKLTKLTLRSTTKPLVPTGIQRSGKSMRVPRLGAEMLKTRLVLGWCPRTLLWCCPGNSCPTETSSPAVGGTTVVLPKMWQKRWQEYVKTI